MFYLMVNSKVGIISVLDKKMAWKFMQL
jgi:hypothetical protein